MFFGGGQGFGDDDDMPGGFPFGGRGGPKKKVDNSKLYTLMGVEKTATADEIRKHFRRRAIKEHPDKGGDPGKFQELSAAYDILSNPEKRKAYDEYGEDALNGKAGGGGGMGDIFSQMFGGGGGQREQPKKQVKPVVEKIDVTLEEMYNGNDFSIEVDRQGLCEGCDGVGGSDPSAVRECDTCDGQGVVMKMQQLGPGMYTQARVKCSDCNGEGELMDKKKLCKKCKGKKVERQKKKHSIQLDKGAPNGEKITLHGQGHQIPDKGVEDGDLIIVVQMKKHARFKRKGADLYLNQEITLLQALTGVDISIEHLDGRSVRIQSAPGQIIEPDSTLTASGLGMPFHKRSYVFGNLFVKFDVKFPKVMDAKAIQFAQSALSGQVSQATANKAASTKAEETVKLAKFQKEQENTHAQGGVEGDSSEEEEHAHQGGHPHMQAGPGCQQQ